MAQYKIYAGLNGGFGGANYQYTEEFNSLADAEMDAYERACNQYESQEGAGIDGWDEFMNEAEQNVEREDDWSDEEYEQALNEYACECSAEARESWIDYWAVEVGSEEDIEEDD